jgi:hypothetical protein
MTINGDVNAALCNAPPRAASIGQNNVNGYTYDAKQACPFLTYGSLVTVSG